MKAETLIRIYNIGWFHRSIINSPGHRMVSVDLDDKPTTMMLSELEDILQANADRLRIILAQQRPMTVNRVVQPYAHAS